MPGAAIRLGPFTSINTESDPTALADSELILCDNLSRDIDGSLISRPPIATTTNSAAWDKRIMLLGVGTHPVTGEQILFGSVDSGTAGAVGTWMYRSGLWTRISNVIIASAIVQYNGIVFFLSQPNATNWLSQWDPITNVFTILNPANLGTMMGASKGGSAMTIFKERLWIVSGNKPGGTAADTSKVFFSAIGAPQTYVNPTDLFVIGQGDGTSLNDVVVFNGQLVLFKNDSTWTLNYVATPAQTDINVASTTIGTLEPRQVAIYNGIMYVYHEGQVHATANMIYTQINLKVPFVYDPSAPSTRAKNVFVVTFGDKLIVRYYNMVYVYNMTVKTWSTWSSQGTSLHNFGYLIAMPSNALAATNVEYYAGSSLTNDPKVFLIKDGYSSIDNEHDDGINYTIKCKMQTKNYDLANSYQYKKLNHWGVELLCASPVVGTATPVLVGFQATWGLVYSSVSDWTQLNTWFNPIASPTSSTTSLGIAGAPIRRFIRFPKALRYRLINFKVEFETDGSTSTGPCKLFSITMFTSTKQVVSKQSN